jgi:hypothetical protein
VSSLADRVQPGLKLREHPFVRRPDIPVLSRCTLSRVVGTTQVNGVLRALMNLRELTYRNEIVGGSIEHAKELGACIVEAPKFEEGPAECDPRREISRVLSQTSLAHPNRLFAVALPPVFLCKLRKSNRRRILKDPASKVFNPGVVSHPYSLSHSHRSRDG